MDSNKSKMKEMLNHSEEIYLKQFFFIRWFIEMPCARIVKQVLRNRQGICLHRQLLKGSVHYFLF